MVKDKELGLFTIEVSTFAIISVTQHNAGTSYPEVVIDRPAMTNARARVRRRRIPTRFRGYLRH